MSKDVNEEQQTKDKETSVDRKSIAVILKEFLIVYVSEATRTHASISDRECAIEDVTTDIDATSTNENSNEGKLVTDLIINKTFIDDLFEFVISDAVWEDEKIELLLTVKQCFINYSGNSNQLTDVTMTFREFYVRNLQVVINRHFNEVLKRVPVEKEACVVKIEQLRQYLNQCFEVYGQDSLYVHVREQYNRLYDYRNQMQELNNKQVELDRKQAELNEQQVKLKQQQAEIETKQKAIDDAIATANESITQQSQKVAESSITILGIFVGIVMVFFGDFSILSSAAAGIFDVSLYRLSLVFLAFGAILFNVIILLFYLVGKITQKSIGNVCAHSTVQFRTVCATCKYKPKLRELCRLRNTLPYVYWGNAVILLLFLFTFCMYALSGLSIELFTKNIQPYDLAIHINDTRSYKGVTVLQVGISSLITVCAANCLCKLGRPLKNEPCTKPTGIKE